MTLLRMWRDAEVGAIKQASAVNGMLVHPGISQSQKEKEEETKSSRQSPKTTVHLSTNELCAEKGTHKSHIM